MLDLRLSQSDPVQTNVVPGCCNALAPFGGLFDHLIGAQRKRLRDVEPDRLGGLEVDDQLELGGKGDRQVGRLGALEDLVDVNRALAGQIEIIRTITTSALRVEARAEWRSMPANDV